MLLLLNGYKDFIKLFKMLAFMYSQRYIDTWNLQVTGELRW